MDIGEEEKVHEIQPSEIDVAPEEAPEDLPAFEPTPKKLPAPAEPVPA